MWWSSGPVLPPSHSWTSFFFIHLSVSYHKHLPQGFFLHCTSPKKPRGRVMQRRYFQGWFVRVSWVVRGTVSLLFLGLYQNKANLCNVLYITSIQTTCFPHSVLWPVETITERQKTGEVEVWLIYSVLNEFCRSFPLSLCWCCHTQTLAEVSWEEGEGEGMRKKINWDEVMLDERPKH